MALEFNGLGKCYRIYDHPAQRLRELLTGRTAHRPYWALADASWRVPAGTCLGIVGDNGAGKSTLLKLITGTLQPTTGTITRHGRLTAILELGTGFHPEFTGRDNIFFAGSLMGITRTELDRRFNDIVAFSELGEFIERPVKTYSSGMFMRLAFSLVTSVDPEILVVDEALAVGDQHFQKKCIDRMIAFRNRGCTILFCSHSLYHVRQLCSQALWLDGGRVAAAGAVVEVLAAYETHLRKENASEPAPEKVVALRPPTAGQSAGCLGKITGVNLDGVVAGDRPLLLGGHLAVAVTAWLKEDQPPPHIGILLERSDGVWVYGVGTHMEGVAPEPLGEGLWRAILHFNEIPLLSGEYVLTAYLFDSTGLVVLEEWTRCQTFEVISATREVGLVRLDHHWA